MVLPIFVHIWKKLAIFHLFFVKNRARFLHIILAGEPMERVKQRIDPEVCTYLDPETNIITVEILLPLVDKDHIYIKVKNDAILVKAENDEIEYSKYIYLSMRLKKEIGKAIYKNDILRITVPAQD